MLVMVVSIVYCMYLEQISQLSIGEVELLNGFISVQLTETKVQNSED